MVECDSCVMVVECDRCVTAVECDGCVTAVQCDRWLTAVECDRRVTAVECDRYVTVRATATAMWAIRHLCVTGLAMEGALTAAQPPMNMVSAHPGC